MSLQRDDLLKALFGLEPLTLVSQANAFQQQQQAVVVCEVLQFI